MFRTGFNYDRDLVSVECGVLCDDEPITVQAAEEECNINTIVRRFGLTGELPNDIRMPRSGDFTGIPDFHSAMNIVRAAQEEFSRVPADIRARFQNDPQRFMAFLEDDANRDEARKLGLLKAEAVIPSSGNPEEGAAAGGAT